MNNNSSCPGCGADLGDDVVCLECGFHTKLGRRLKTKTSRRTAKLIILLACVPILILLFVFSPILIVAVRGFIATPNFDRFLVGVVGVSLILCAIFGGLRLKTKVSRPVILKAPQLLVLLAANLAFLLLFLARNGQISPLVCLIVAGICVSLYAVQTAVLAATVWLLFDDDQSRFRLDGTAVTWARCLGLVLAYSLFSFSSYSVTVWLFPTSNWAILVCALACITFWLFGLMILFETSLGKALLLSMANTTLALILSFGLLVGMRVILNAMLGFMGSE